MAEGQDARLLELVEVLGGDRVRGLFRELLQRALQELIDSESTAQIGAGPHERTETRTNRRNGARSRVLSTPAGDVELRIPKGACGVVLPVVARAQASGGSGVVGGDHDRQCDRHLDAQGR